jgi:hypothetical protein
MHTAADRDAKRRHQAGVTALRDTPADDVGSIGAWCHIQQQKCIGEQAEIGNAEQGHGCIAPLAAFGNKGVIVVA